MRNDLDQLLGFELTRRLPEHAYVGGCGSGRYEDIVAIAHVLKGRQVCARMAMALSMPTESACQ